MIREQNETGGKGRVTCNITRLNVCRPRTFAMRLFGFGTRVFWGTWGVINRGVVSNWGFRVMIFVKIGGGSTPRGYSARGNAFTTILFGGVLHCTGRCIVLQRAREVGTLYGGTLFHTCGKGVSTFLFNEHLGTRGAIWGMAGPFNDVGTFTICASVVKDGTPYGGGRAGRLYPIATKERVVCFHRELFNFL